MRSGQELCWDYGYEVRDLHFLFTGLIDLFCDRLGLLLTKKSSAPVVQITAGGDCSEEVVFYHGVDEMSLLIERDY